MVEPEGPGFFELMRQALSSTREGYDLLAPKFDHTPYRTPRKLIDLMVPFIGTPRAALDVCCGTGAGLEALLENPAIRRVTGIDFSEGMLAQARLHHGSDPRLELIQQDVLKMNFHEEFDAAICLGALGHFTGDDYTTLLRQIHRSLKPGGIYVFPAGPIPAPGSSLFWFCLFFNAAMRVRNFLLRPPFIMYYHRLMFQGPDLFQLLQETGFTPENHEVDSLAVSDGLVSPRFCIIVARKKIS